MNCKEFQERISAAVDRCLARQEMDQFEEHARRCGPCNREYENECSTKGLLRQYARSVHVPADLQVCILDRIDREAGGSDGEHPLFRLWRAPLLRAAFAFALTVVVVAMFFSRLRESPETLPFMPAGLGPNNVVRQSIDGYHRILRGDIAPQLMSSEPMEVQNFFTGKTSFPVLVPLLKECTLVGGAVNEHHGVELAHIMYRAGDNLIFVYQTCWETVQQGRALEITPEAKTALLQTGWYTHPSAGNDAAVLWTHDQTLCIAVSHMGVGRLLASVKPGAGSTPP